MISHGTRQMFNLEQANKQKVSYRKTKEQSGRFLYENVLFMYLEEQVSLTLPPSMEVEEYCIRGYYAFIESLFNWSSGSMRP